MIIRDFNKIYYDTACNILNRIIKNPSNVLKVVF